MTFMDTIKAMLGLSTKKTNDGETLPKTAQDTIPYRNVYSNDIIESAPNYYTKMYQIEDINFRVASEESQLSIFKGFREFVDSFDSKLRVQIIINNRNMDEQTFLESIRCHMEKDDLNDLREELNQVLEDKMHEGRNNLTSDKYIVVGGEYPSIKEATVDFARLDNEIIRRFTSISEGRNDDAIRVVSIKDRLKILHDILNNGKENELTEVDFNTLREQHLSTKDAISPAGFRFTGKNFRMGDKWACCLYIKNYPSTLSTNFMSDLGSLPFNFTASFTLEPIEMDVAVKTIQSQMTAIRGDVIKAEKKAYQNMYSPDLISTDLKDAREQSETLMAQLRASEQKLYKFNMTIMILADSKDELTANVKSVTSLGNKYSIVFNNLMYQQEAGFRCALPLARNDVKVRRIMTSDSVSLFLPFTTKELMQKNGFYYGLNAVSNNMIVINRLNSKNYNGLILGQSGSGKSFCAKREMLSAYLSTTDHIYVIDPDSEYAHLAKILGGSVVKLAPGTKVYINPFDMDIHYGDSDTQANANPVTLKSDYICMLCETAVGRRYELSNVERSIIDRVVIQLYEPYIRHMMNDIMDKSITCDTAASPTMDMFYDALMNQPEPEAQNLGLNMEIYCVGSSDLFSRRTNVDINNRFTVFDIKDIGNGMKEIGLQVCLNHIWNKMIENQRLGLRTRLYIDEFHVLTKTRSSIAYLQQIWKRARKWNGIPTGITQNVSDLLTSQEAVTIISNTEFIIMLGQSPADRIALQDMYHISDAQLTYITNSPPGQGLIYDGQTIVPFIDKFPQETKLYKLMSSKPEERIME